MEAKVIKVDKQGRTDSIKALLRFSNDVDENDDVI